MKQPGRGGFVLSNNHSQGTNGNNIFGQRREREGRGQGPHAFNGTGALPPLNTTRSYSGGFDFEAMLTSLHELFAQDRQVASQQESKRCGICYLYFAPEELQYRESEGFYACAGCAQALGKQTLPMIRRQQK
jgi:hypothetical protein